MRGDNPMVSAFCSFIAVVSLHAPHEEKKNRRQVSIVPPRLNVTQPLGAIICAVSFESEPFIWIRSFESSG